MRLRGDLPGEIDRALHRGVAALETHLAVRLADDFLQSGHLLLQRPQPGDAIDHQLHLGRRKGLGEVIGGPALHGLHRVVDRAVRRDDHDAHPRALRKQLRDEIRSQIGPEVQIDQRQVERLLGRLG